MPLCPDRIPRFIPENQTDGPHIDKQFSDSARFTRFANYLGIPAIAFPTGKDESGLPTGRAIDRQARIGKTTARPGSGTTGNDRRLTGVNPGYFTRSNDSRTTGKSLRHSLPQTPSCSLK